MLLTAAGGLGAASVWVLADASMRAWQADTASRLPIVTSSAQAEASVGHEVFLEGRISSTNPSTTLRTWVPSRDAPSEREFVIHERTFAAYWREPVRQESTGQFFGPRVRVVPRGLRVELAPGLDATIENANFYTFFDSGSAVPFPQDDLPAIDWVNGFEIGERVVVRGRLERRDGGWTIEAALLDHGTASDYLEHLRAVADESEHSNGAFTGVAWFALVVAVLLGAASMRLLRPSAKVSG